MSIERIDKLEHELSKDFKLAIDVRDADEGKYVQKKIYGSQIKAKFGNLKAYLSKLYHEDKVKNAVIQAYRENGTSWKKYGDHIVLQLSGSDEASATPSQSSVKVDKPAYTPPPPTQSNYNQNPFGFGLNGAGFGLNGAMVEVAQLYAVKEKLENLKKDYDELKEDYRDLKTDYRKQEILNAELQSKVDTAQKDKELAVQMAKLENKSFMDSEAGKKLAENLPTIMQAFSSARGQVIEPPGLSMPDLDGVKGQFVETISQDAVTDDMIDLLNAVLIKTYQDETFKNQIINLINQSKVYEESNTNQGEQSY